jgi:hypothetical protein
MNWRSEVQVTSLFFYMLSGVSVIVEICRFVDIYLIFLDKRQNFVDINAKLLDFLKLSLICHVSLHNFTIVRMLTASVKSVMMKNRLPTRFNA